MKSLLLGVLLTVVIGFPTYTAAQTKSLTISNTLILSGSARRIATTATVPNKWPRPIRWRVVLDGRERYVGEDAVAPFTLVDTVWQAMPVEQLYRITAYSADRRDSVFRTLRITRVFTAGEIAFLDTFPQRDHRLRPCGRHQYRADSMGNPTRDSLPVTATATGASVRRGFLLFMGTFARNRYTGQVEIIAGDPVRCEPTRRELAASFLTSG
jgi:hypothetical protein